MLGGCKLTLNAKILHKSYITEIFGPRVFCFSVGQKKFGDDFLAIFLPDLQINFKLYKPTAELEKTIEG